MRNLVAAITVLSVAALPSAASAKPRLSIPRATASIARAEHVAIHRCHRNGPLKVRCRVSEVITEGTYAGWTFAFTAEATLRKSGNVDVTTPDL